MPAAPRSGYSLLQILLHWAIATLVILQLVFGESMVTVIEAAEDGTAAPVLDQQRASLHYWFGLAILALVAFRIVLRLSRGVPAATGVSPLAAKAASLTHAVFYVLLVIVPLTGLLGYYVGDPWGEWHTLAKPVFIVLIAAHALAALYHQFWVKDGTLRRMIVPAGS